MKAGWLALGGLIWTAPLLAQPSDPLAPLPQGSTSPKVTKLTSSATQPATVEPVAPTTAAVTVPKDWRGVFDAIDAGDWASARVGIAALPPGILAPVAKAELYTARGSPTADLSSLLALVAEAPELPQADQLARLAVTRGAVTPPPVVT